MTTFSASKLLELWEAGVSRHPIDRALAMLSLADVAGPLAEMPLGQRNWHLMQLRRARFGDHLSLWLDCSACGDRMSMEFGVSDLPDTGPGGSRIVVEGHAFRLANSRDLANLVSFADPELAAHTLFLACAESLETLPQGEALDQLMDRVGEAMDAADPWADLNFEAQCPACATAHNVPLDIGDLLWQELEIVARQLLDRVHQLASAYGWSEQAILALSDTRRAAYLARLGT
ncbi:hypothetical protein Q5Y75_26965 [Ruegeria sp. 2205SS24-7]|uniref:hypothetical protein n=1 Tax=Ruegeria discodermiae TaxID=3064389 RepID=UPI002740DE12|nr:hypothetical protein [Ruegeria sp. 2205SS24-7]MDP5220833.1 hypothetical protein [Ruegeria sp. 2205SS24-7]